MENSPPFGALFGALVATRRAEKRLTQGQLAALVWPNDQNAEAARKGDISKLERGKTPNPHSTTVKRIADALGISEAECVDLRRQAHMTPAERLQEVPTLNRDQLELLASRFEIETPHQLDDPTLRALLTQKAEEYRTYKAEIDAIDERTKGLGNLKAAAKAAAEKLNFEEVDTLLSMVHATELDIAAQTAELRADNALLRGRVEQAFHLLSGAADTFAQVDPVEPGIRRIDFATKLARHGQRYGGSGLSLAIEMWRNASQKLSRDAHPVNWATTQNNLAIALQNQGTRTGGAEGASLLAEAVTAYRAALEVYTREAHPVDWAMTQNNLATALANQGARTGGAEGAALLAEAVTAYRAALEVYTRDAHPVDWAMTQNNLAAALQHQGTRTGGAEGAALLAEAVTAYRAALEVYTRDAHPVDWAMTQNNLAAALADQGTRTGGAEGAALLAEAVTACRAALEVRTRDAHPVDWAETQNNLANALQNQGIRSGGAEGAANLAKAVTAYRAALEVYTRDAHPVHWAMTQENLGLAYKALSDLAPQSAREHLEEALACFERALEVFDPEHMPYNHTKATEARARVAAALAAL